MSFVKPKEYKLISEKLGDAFAIVRDAINNGTETGDAYEEAFESLFLIADSSDTEVIVDKNIDPIGSIMNDLGSTWQSSVNNNFSTSNANTIASNLFGNMLRRLNEHVQSRTLNPLTSSRHRNIQEWYRTYAFTGNEDYSLFWNGGTPPDAGDYSDYFTQNFEELCSSLNITIPNEYKQSSY